MNCELIYKSGVGRKQKMSDLEVVALSLTAEFMSIDSENSLFKQLNQAEIPNLIERSQFNKRRRKLFLFSEEIRTKLAKEFLEFEDYFIVDSMPLEICKFSRHSRIKICKEEFESAPSKGFCASQNNWYFGYKLHGVCSVSGIFHSLDITKAEVHDVHFLKNIKQQMSDCVLLGDRGYLSESIQLDLFQTVKVRLETPKRSNQKDYKQQPYIFRKSRKRIETLFSQLCDQFMIRRNYAKSFEGFKTRILAKITSLTLVQYINKFIFDRPINNIKIQII
ncbi:MULTISPECIES: IS982 family transposase [Flavobacteriaceae]|uniref:IS982 family transposase n=1 Tax=Flavobacteriaceae TaxID=49546 RepID=UPI001CE0DE88|nr:IS982 family transposase [Myroides odoratimimus]MCA4794519.1 IS982 family transposase [Myroides odoratimimus]MCA4808134.1 IS982 family transposase [Myroides odoratimimus]MCA4821778.1 IS982 family transposase [Myroides odoratimimus]MDM1521633.1 IS982 family transposase [Myroides odoratimimus]